MLLSPLTEQYSRFGQERRVQVLQSANVAYARREKPVGRIIGVALLAAMYGVVLYASIGLFQTSSTDTYYTVNKLIGLLNVVVLPLLVLAAVAGVRRIWLDDTPHVRISRLLTAPLWASFTLSLLTVPIWMGQANVERQGSHTTALGSIATFLLAPWGFLLAYGLSLFVVCAMFDFTFPVRAEANTQSSAAGPG